MRLVQWSKNLVVRLMQSQCSARPLLPEKLQLLQCKVFGKETRKRLKLPHDRHCAVRPLPEYHVLPYPEVPSFSGHNQVFSAVLASMWLIGSMKCGGQIVAV